MATIPVYQPDQVQAQTLPNARQAQVSSSLFARPDYAGDMAQGLQGVGNAVARINLERQQKEDTALSTQLEAKWQNDLTDYKINASKRLGANAFGLAGEADKFYQELAKKTIEAAPNERIKAYMGAVTMKHQPQFKTYIDSHASSETTKAEALGLDAKIASHKNAAASDPSTAYEHIAEITEATKVKLAKQGITDPEAVKLAILEEKSSAHTGVINAMMVNNPKAALAYFGTHKDEILAAQQTKYSKELKTINEANDALEGADSVWNTLGPKGDGQPVQLDVMESKVREMFDGDAGKIKATIDELRSRASAFNSSERERMDSSKSKVLGAFAQGASLAQLRKMPEFAQLDGEAQNQIREHVEAKAYQAEARAAARESRLAARESRANTAAERAERETRRKNFTAYMGVYSKPEVIASMSENAIIGMTPQLGEDIVFSMLKQRRELAGKPEKIFEAQVEANDFNQIAKTMGLDPYTKDADKAALGELKFRVSNVIEAEQTRLGKKLDRKSVQEIMRREAANYVAVDGGWFGSDKQVPAIAVTSDTIDKVVLSGSERTTALNRLKKLRELNPSDNRYAPTEANLKRIHLQSISKAVD